MDALELGGPEFPRMHPPPSEAAAAQSASSDVLRSVPFTSACFSSVSSLNPAPQCHAWIPNVQRSATDAIPVLQGRGLSRPVPVKVAVAGGVCSHVCKAHAGTISTVDQPTTTEVTSSAGSEVGLLRQQGCAVGT